MQNIHLITGADDAGSCRSANAAILESVEAGIIKNVSFMAVGPEIEHAVELLGGRDDIAYGFHVRLNAEWEDVKWGPLTDATLVVDANGHFLPFPNDTKAQIESCSTEAHDEIMSEVSAQLQTLRELGLPISYLDEHIGVSRIGFRDQLAAFCAQESIIDHPPLPSMPKGESSGDMLLDFESRLKAAILNQYVWVTHPDKDETDMQNFNLVGTPKGIVAKERDAERRLLTDPRLPALFNKYNVKATRYDEI